MLRIGIDVGGTNTDAVLMDGSEVRASHKATTSADVGGGVVAALRGVLAGAELAPERVEAVMIGTTHFVNAVVERRRLVRTGVVRLALPANTGLPPLTGWPADLRAAIGGVAREAHGGREYNGRAMSPLDEDELRRIARELREDGVRSIAISALFAPMSDDMELTARDVIRDEAPELHVTLSSRVGRLGLIERENATTLNAALRDLASDVVDQFRSALRAAGIAAPLFISQNDGTLMSDVDAQEYPVLTFASGPSNSIRGAALLSGVTDGLVVDIGGTTLDIGALRGGMPREALNNVDMAGLRTNFRMPDLLSVGLGGGSVVRERGGRVEIGPDSVGRELTSRALAFGGDTLTATDVAVAAGQVELGDPARVAHLAPGLVAEALELMHARVADAVDRMKTSAAPVPMVLVGGGNVLVSREVAGTAETLRPRHAEVANAVGAAIAQVGGEVDRVFSLEASSREEVLAQARQEAIYRAVASGAAPDSVEIVDIEEIPTHLPPPATGVRVRAKAVGDLRLEVAA